MNMLSLYFLSPAVLAMIGYRRFLTVYFMGALSCSLFHIVYFNGILPARNPSKQRDVSALGASGSIMSICVIYASLFPSQKLFLYGIVPVSARLCVAMLVGFDAYHTINGSTWQDIGHAGHLAGAAFGLLYYLQVLRPLIMRF